MRIAIVNDIRMAVEALRRIVLSQPGYEIAWVAYDGAEAVAKCAKDIPDLILMDLIMPVMGGVQATELIMKHSPCAILIVTSTVSGHSSKVFEAMGFGALDVVRTPAVDMSRSDLGGGELLKKIARIGILISKTPHIKRESPDVISEPASKKGELPPLLLIGSSTGGPGALAKILAHFPPKRSFATIIVQHVDEQFAVGLARWLGGQTSLPVTLAEPGAQPYPGVILLASKNDHLIMTSAFTLRYSEKPIENPYRPSVDVFFNSVAKLWPHKGVAVLLTGMGCDGAIGLKALKNSGWITIAQDEKSCVVYGMPKAAADIGAAQIVLPIEEIGPEVIELISKQVRT